ncbi:DUF2399 domain-containing protein [Enterococcus sp. LJL98]
MDEKVIMFFLKNQETWESWFSLLAKRYSSYETFGGYIRYDELGTVDKFPIKEFLGLSQIEYENKTKFSVKKFKIHYARSVLAENNSLEEVIEYFTGQKLVTKKELMKEEFLKRKEFDFLVIKILGDKTNLLSEPTCSNLFKKWRKDESTIESLEKAKYALDRLPDTYMQLPYFSNQLFQNAHELDVNTLTGEVFNSMLKQLFKLSNDTRRSEYSKVEMSEEMYTHVNLMRGDHTIHAFVQGIYSDGPSMTWNIHGKERDSWVVRKGQALEATNLYTKKNKIFVVENDGVFQILTEMFPTLPFLSTSGQPNYTVLKIIEKLVVSGTMIYYSSDLDPNGLSMAQNILKLFPRHVKIVGMNKELYDCKLKTKALTIHQLRLLDNILVPDFQELKQEMYRVKKAVEQEALTEIYFELLEKWIRE